MYESAQHEDDRVWTLGVDAVLHTYALLAFAYRRWTGAIVLLCTFAFPVHAAIGLAGVVITLVAAVWQGFERGQIRDGRYLINSLLVALTLGHLYSYGQISLPLLALLLVICSVLTLFLTVALASQLALQFHLPVMTLPYVIVHLLCLVLIRYPYHGSAYSAYAYTATSTDQPSTAWQRLVDTMSMLTPDANTDPRVLAIIGAAACALLIYSRLLTLYGLVGLGVGLAVLSAFPIQPSPSDCIWICLNLLGCSMALGGVAFIPSRATLLLVAISGALCTVVGIAAINLFQPLLGFWPIALPVNVVVLLVVYVMKLRPAPKYIHATPFVPKSPEENFRQFHTGMARFPEFGFPSILCPFAGERVVTQGIGGSITHRGDWKYALDFEVEDESGRKSNGSLDKLEDYFTYNTPVLAPGSGVVVKTVDHVEDRPIGSNNFGSNWGNLVIIQLDGGPFVTLCHLKQRSVKVKEGQRVKEGEVLGYCGNSGRSPIPHLHVQLQTSPQVGATNIPFRLRHYIERNGDGRAVYHTAGIPNENVRVQGALFDRWRARCFDNIAQREYMFQVRQGDTERTEVITCNVDSMGFYLFQSDHGEQLKGFVADHAFYAMEYEGGRSGVLFWLWLGLSRVPFIEDQRTGWRDAIDIRPLLRRLAGLYYDLVGPFASYPELNATGQWQPADQLGRNLGADACVETTFSTTASSRLLAGALPTSIHIYVSEAEWVVGAVIEVGDDMVAVEQVAS